MKGKALGLIVLVVMLAACGGNDLQPTDEGGTDVPTTETLPAAYPPAVPSVTPFPEGYPAPPTSAPYDPYPSGRVWIIRPLGIQCAGPETHTYSDVDEAVEALQDMGISVFDAEAAGREVCEACDCPTSEHFRLLIEANALDRVVAMGWYADPEQ